MSQVQSDDHVTRLLHDAASADRAATDELLALVYDELHSIAHRLMADERADHTLQATILVHEAYLRIVGDREIHWSCRAQFFSAAAKAMRRLLVDHARTKGRLKRGGGRERLPANVLDMAAQQDSDEILALHEALCRLEEEEPDVARVVELRFFAGMTIDDTAEAIGVSPRQVDRLWKYARAWLYRELHTA